MCLKWFFQYGKSDYAQLMPAAFKHWKEIEEKSGKKLFTPAGIMNIRKRNEKNIPSRFRYRTRVSANIDLV